MKSLRIALLGTGLVGGFYARSLLSHRGRDQIHVVYSRSKDQAQGFAQQWSIPKFTIDMNEAIADPDVDLVVVAIPNFLHEPAVTAAAQAGKGVLCTKPLGRNAAEALRMLHTVEQAGVFHGYLEDLVYTPKTIAALSSVRDGAIGDVLWVRSRETHPGPHSDWFWDPAKSGGGAIIDLGCHCIEIARSFIGKDIRPLEVVCWADTQVHAIETEDHAIGLVRYENGAIGQFEVSWCFRGGMDLRDEVAGTQGTIWINHWLRTGLEMFSAAPQAAYVAEKSENESGWLFPVGDEPAALGYDQMFQDMLAAAESNSQPRESFYDGYVVAAIMDAAYQSAKSKQWEPIELEIWRGRQHVDRHMPLPDFDRDHTLIKRERMPDGSMKWILRHKITGAIEQRITR